MYCEDGKYPDFRTSTPSRDRFRSIAEMDEINRSTVRSRFPYETQSNMGPSSHRDFVDYSTPRRSVTFDPMSVVSDTLNPHSNKTLGISSKGCGQSGPTSTTTTMSHAKILQPSIASKTSSVGFIPHDFSTLGLDTQATQIGLLGTGTQTQPIGVGTQTQQVGARQHNSLFPPSFYHSFDTGATAASDLTKKEIEPPVFNGQGNWKHFIFRFEQIAAYNGWDDRTKRLRLTICLDGDALDYCGTLRFVETLTYADLKDALNSRFSLPENQNMYRSQFRSRVRRENEDINAFLGDLQKLAGKAFPREQNNLFHQLICDQFTQGIRNRECREFLQLEMSKSRASGHMLVQEMLTLALNFEAVRGPLDKPRKPMTDYDRPSYYAPPHYVGPRNGNVGQDDYQRPNRYPMYNADRLHNADRLMQQHPRPMQYDPRPMQYNPMPMQHNPRPVQYDPRPVQHTPRPIQQNTRFRQDNQGNKGRNPQPNREQQYQRSRIICDICNREGHVASRCWYANQEN